MLRNSSDVLLAIRVRMGYVVCMGEIPTTSTKQMTVAYGQPPSQPKPEPKTTAKPTPQTRRVHAHQLYTEAKNCTSLAGTLCQYTGAMGAAIGAALTIVSAGSGNPAAALMSGGATVAMAMAGAPIAALGSIATYNKRQAKFAELDAWLKKENY